jgi:hypothetical protein
VNRELRPALAALLLISVGGCADVLSLMGTSALDLLSFLAFAILLLPPALRAAARPPEWQPALRRPFRALHDGTMTALVHHRILLLIAMLTSATLAADPVLMLARAVARHMDDPNVQLGYFLFAFGAGAILGALIPLKDRHICRPQIACHRAALRLICLGASIGLFAEGLSIWLCLGAAFVAGLVTVQACALVLAGLARQTEPASPRSRVGVTVLWMVAWVQAKALAAVMDSWLPQHLGLVPAAIVVTTPAMTLGLVELLLTASSKRQVAAAAVLLVSSLVGWLTLPDGAEQAAEAGATLRETRSSPHVTRVAAGLAGFVARVTGDQLRYGEEFGSELWDLAAAGKGSYAQLAYVLRQFVAAGALRAATRSERPEAS